MRVVLAPDIMYQRKADFEAQGLHSGLGDWDQDIERSYLSNAEIIVAIQEHDAQVLRQMLPESEVICVPIAATLRTKPDVAQVAGRCLFVGSYVDHNIIGLQWFLENVWPIIIARDSFVTLHVCGGVCKSVSRRYAQVELLGQVENLDNEYSAAEVCLVPLHVGSGLKIKLVQALSYGRVCVSTSVGVQGLPEIAEAGVTVADTPAEFAEAIHVLLSDDDRRAVLEQRALQYVEAQFAPEVAFGPFVNRIADHMRGQTIPSPSGTH
jgi:glycosyltransferase involved in cell wall biosynthesis